MSTSSQVTDFVDCYTDLLQRMRDVTTSTNISVTLAKRYINVALHDVHIQQNWPWAERQAVLVTHAPYTTGRVSIAAATRTTLEGSSSTLWNTAVTGLGFNNLRARGKLTLSGESDVYIISAVSSDVAATLESAYIGGLTTATAYALAYGSYTYYEDEYALASDFWRMVDVRQFSDAINLPIIPKQEFFRDRPRNSTTGRPRACTLLDLGPSTSTAGRPRVLLTPAPDAVMQIPYRYITANLAVSSAGVGAANLSADSDEPIIPLRYRHALVYYAAYQWYRDRKDDQRSQEAQADYVDLIKRMANDSDPQRDHPRLQTNRGAYRMPMWTVNRGRRYSVDDRFDEMRD